MGVNRARHTFPIKYTGKSGGDLIFGEGILLYFNLVNFLEHKWRKLIAQKIVIAIIFAIIDQNRSLTFL